MKGQTLFPLDMFLMPFQEASLRLDGVAESSAPDQKDFGPGLIDTMTAPRWCTLIWFRARAPKRPSACLQSGLSSPVIGQGPFTGPITHGGGRGICKEQGFLSSGTNFAEFSPSQSTNCSLLGGFPMGPKEIVI